MCFQTFLLALGSTFHLDFESGAESDNLSKPEPEKIEQLVILRNTSPPKKSEHWCLNTLSYCLVPIHRLNTLSWYFVLILRFFYILCQYIPYRNTSSSFLVFIYCFDIYIVFMSCLDILYQYLSTLSWLLVFISSFNTLS